MQVPRHWRHRRQSYALQGETCPRCKSHLFPPRAVCPRCANGSQEASVYAGRPVAVVAPRLQPVER
jgi:uncharacterized OB-fold protein